VLRQRYFRHRHFMLQGVYKFIVPVPNILNIRGLPPCLDDVN
jgi:hypothetical protein